MVAFQNTSREIDESKEFEHLTAEEILAWAFEVYEPRLALASSFQAEESVLIDMMARLRGSDFRVFTLDTGRLNQETYGCMDALRERYGIKIEVFFPDPRNVEKMVEQHGLNLFRPQAVSELKAGDGVLWKIEELGE